MGTGPFKFKSYTQPVEFEAEKNPDYFKKGLPDLDGIKMHFIPEISTQVDAFVANRVDMSPPGIGYGYKEQLDRLEK
ncbi:ABC transporter substrate-binding protein [Chloroflexota bacterium]